MVTRDSSRVSSSRFLARRWVCSDCCCRACSSLIAALRKSSSLVALLLAGLPLLEVVGLFAGEGAFGDGDDAEGAAGLATLDDGLSHALEVVADLGDENHVGTAGQPGSQCQPSGVVAHDLDNDDAVVAMGSRVQAIDRLGCDRQGGVVAEGHVRHRHIVVDRFRQGEYPQARLRQMESVLLRSPASQAHQCVEMVLRGSSRPSGPSCPSSGHRPASCAVCRGWFRGWSHRPSGCRRAVTRRDEWCGSASTLGNRHGIRSRSCRRCDERPCRCRESPH